MAETNIKDTPLRLLSLDGGGIRGVSELIILQQIMLQVQKQNDLQKTPKPCEVFDMIGGTSTGGLIAIMLGRLQMTVEQAIGEYDNLSKVVFGEKKPFYLDGKFKATNLENAIKGIIQRYRREDPNAKLFAPGQHCKAIFPGLHVYSTFIISQLYRSYATGTPDDCLDVSICEAARATSAAPVLFKRQRMSHPGNTGEFVDGAIGANNPAKLLIAEAQRIFSPTRGVSCIVSIGTGRKSISDVKAPGLMQRLFQRMLFPTVPINAVLAAKDIVTNCEAVAEDLDRRFARVPGLYCRFNVENGLTKIKLDEYKKLGQIKALTIQYLQEPWIEERVKQASHFLYNGVISSAPVEHLA